MEAARHSLVSRYRRNRFALLLTALLGSLALHPLISVLVPGLDPTEWLLAVNLVAAVASAQPGRRVASLLVLATGCVIARLAHPLLGIRALLSLSQFLWIVAIVGAAVVSAEHAFRRGHATQERVCAALDAYLLAGFAFGVAFWLLEREQPGSFGSAITSLAPQDAVYLSFFTLSTLGLGTAIPSNGIAKALMTFEAVAGQIYLTVLVARLVSLYASEQGDRR